VVCRGLGIDHSGKVAKKRLRHENRSPRPQCYRCERNLSLSTADAAATAYKHINVAIVRRSHFGNAKPKFHMNCWSTISINDRSCQQRCITGPANILTCTYSFIFTIIQKYWQTAEEYTPVQLSLCTVKQNKINYGLPRIAYLAHAPKQM